MDEKGGEEGEDRDMNIPAGQGGMKLDSADWT